MPIDADIEARRQAEQDRLDRLKVSDERNRLGQFATPPALALDIVKYALKLREGRSESVSFLEPALGTGSFYSALRRVFPSETITEAVGIEIDPAVAGVASALWKKSGLTVIEADFTRLEPDRRFNLILTNPPYVRHHHLIREDKGRLQSLIGRRLRIDISGLAGLYCHFLLLCDAWMKDGGHAAWLIPSEFMDVNYGTAVKEYLTERVRLLRIHRCCPSDAQFGDALVTSAIVVFEKTAPSDSLRVSMSFGGSISSPSTSEDVPLKSLRDSRKWTQYPSHGTKAEPHGATLGDFFIIKRGLATGANSFFILERREALRRGIPRDFLRPILPSSRHLRESVIEADHEGYPKLTHPLAVIDCDLPEEEIRGRFPAFWDYLDRGKRQEIHLGYLASRRTPWYSQEKREPAPFLCTYMGRKASDGNPFRFFWNKSKATAANVYLLLYPKGGLKRALDSRPELYPIILSILQDIDPDHFLRGGRVYGGGLYKMEPKELALLSGEPIAKAIGVPSTPQRLDLRS